MAGRVSQGRRILISQYTWHCNRHTFASRLVKAGVDLHTVGKLLWHKTARMTKRYAHLSVNHKQAAVGQISGGANAIKTASGRKGVSGVSPKSL
jgi:integrase